MEEKKSEYTILAGKPEGKRPFGRPKNKWKDDIKVELKEMGYITVV
jgi:hypothetical protein